MVKHKKWLRNNTSRVDWSSFYLPYLELWYLKQIRGKSSSEYEYKVRQNAASVPRSDLQHCVLSLFISLHWLVEHNRTVHKSRRMYILQASPRIITLIINVIVYLSTLSPPNSKVSFGTTFAFNIIKSLRKQRLEWIKTTVHFI